MVKFKEQKQSLRQLKGVCVALYQDINTQYKEEQQRADDRYQTLLAHIDAMTNAIDYASKSFE